MAAEGRSFLEDRSYLPLHAELGGSECAGLVFGQDGLRGKLCLMWHEMLGQKIRDTLLVRQSAPSQDLPHVGAAETLWLGGQKERVGIGGFAGGALEHPRPWRDVQCLGLFLGVPSCPEPQQVAKG